MMIHIQGGKLMGVAAPHHSSAVDKRRELTIERLWNITEVTLSSPYDEESSLDHLERNVTFTITIISVDFTQALNVLYKENWTVMANMEMIKFQGEMVAALQVLFMVVVLVE